MSTLPQWVQPMIGGTGICGPIAAIPICSIVWYLIASRLPKLTTHEPKYRLAVPALPVVTSSQLSPNRKMEEPGCAEVT